MIFFLFVQMIGLIFVIGMWCQKKEKTDIELQEEYETQKFLD